MARDEQLKASDVYVNCESGPSENVYFGQRAMTNRQATDAEMVDAHRLAIIRELGAHNPDWTQVITSATQAAHYDHRRDLALMRTERDEAYAVAQERHRQLQRIEQAVHPMQTVDADTGRPGPGRDPA